MTFADRLNHAIDISSDKLVWIATQSRIDPASLRRLRSGDQRNPTIRMVAQLAKTLNVSPSWLAFGEGSPGAFTIDRIHTIATALNGETR